MKMWKSARDADPEMADALTASSTFVPRVSDPTLTALKVTLEVKQEVAPWVDLANRRRLFRKKVFWSYPNGEALLEWCRAFGADVIGAIPHFEFTREYGVESLHKNLAPHTEMADRLIDALVTKLMTAVPRFVETVAALAHRDGMGRA